MQGGDDAFHADLPQHRERDLVLLPEPSPGFFHSRLFLGSNLNKGTGILCFVNADCVHLLQMDKKKEQS
jgi:hypothetical protein